MASRLIFERRQFQGIDVIFVSVRLRPRPKPIEPPAHESRAFIESLTWEQCQLIAEIVAGELRKRQLWKVKAGDRIYCAVEANVIHEILRRGDDLSEIAARIEEEKWEAQYLEAA